MADKGTSVALAIAAAKASKATAGAATAASPIKVSAVLPLASILDRPGGDTRPINDAHTAELVDSIAAIGLIQPLAVDRSGHLLAGGHRRAALLQLEQEQPARFAELFPQGIPVNAIDIDASQDQDRAIAIEAAENEKRRDYTPAEVRALAEKLVSAGYSDGKGKPGKGQKPLQPALMAIVGKSRATVQRYLSQPLNASSEAIKASPQPTEAETLAKAQARLLKALESFELCDGAGAEALALAAQLRELLVRA
jgi:ParB family transcriptional regulator, chromosome partitioning protein